MPFTYTPSNAVGATATGTLTIDPLDFGGDDMGKDMTSDFTWTIVGDPVYTYGASPRHRRPAGGDLLEV